MGFSLGPEFVPVEQRIASTSPNRLGVYPHEALLLHSAPSIAVGGRPQQQYWAVRYGVQDPGAILDSLAARGFIEPGSADAVLTRQTIPALKAILSTRGLPVSGKKADLVERVRANVGNAELEQIFPERNYALTSTGQAVVDATPYVLYAHQRTANNGPDIFELSQLVETSPELPWRDLIRGHLDRRGLEFQASGDWGLYSNTRRALAPFLAEEGKYLEAIATLTEVLYYDLSGMGNSFDAVPLRVHTEVLADFIAPCDRSNLRVPSALLTWMFDWAGAAGLTDAQLWCLLAEQFAQHDSPIRVFTTDECVQIVFLARANDVGELDRIYRQGAARFRMSYGV